MFSKGTYKLVVISTETINKPENMHARRNSCVCCERNWPSQISISMLLPPATLVVSAVPIGSCFETDPLSIIISICEAGRRQSKTLVLCVHNTEPKKQITKVKKRCMLRRVGCWPYLFRNVNFTVIKQCIETDKRMQPKTRALCLSPMHFAKIEQKKSGRRNHKKNHEKGSLQTL